MPAQTPEARGQTQLQARLHWHCRGAQPWPSSSCPRQWVHERHLPLADPPEQALTPLSRHWGLTKLLQMLQGEGLLEALVPSEVGCTPRPARFCGGAAREAAWLDELCAPLWQPCPSFFHPRSQRKRCLSSASPWRNLKVLQLCLHNASKCCALPDCKIFRIEARGASLPPGFGSHTMQTSRLCTVRHWEKTEIKTSCRA